MTKRGRKKKRPGRITSHGQRVSRRHLRAGQVAGREILRVASNYPFEGCWVQDGWDEHGLAVLVIARRSPKDRLYFASYLIDYYCLGLKDTFFNIDISQDKFRDVLRDVMPSGPVKEISPDLAHEIIYGGIEYAAQFGFRPHPDYRMTRHFLDPEDAHPRTGTVSFGHEGKPLYIAGPHDDQEAIMRQLERTAGAGNFDFVIGAGPDADVWLYAEDD